MRSEILAKLAEVAALLEQAECDGEKFVGTDAYEEIEETLNKVIEQVDYYVD